MVAKKVRDSLPLILSTQWEARSNQTEETDDDDDEWCDSDQNQNHDIPDMYLPLKHSILKAFKLMDKELNLHPTMDCFCSGTTAVTFVKQVSFLIIMIFIYNFLSSL